MDEKVAAFQWSMIWNDAASNNGGGAGGAPLGGSGNGNGNVFWDEPVVKAPSTALKANTRQQNGVAKSATEPRPFETNLVNSKQKAVSFTGQTLGLFSRIECIHSVRTGILLSHFPEELIKKHFLFVCAGDNFVCAEYAINSR